MLQFKIFLWVLTRLLQRTAKTAPACANYIRDKELAFQIRTEDGVGRHFRIADGRIRSTTRLTERPEFTMIFRDAVTGFRVLTAKDGQSAFLQALHDGTLTLKGNFVEVLWFQGLAEHLKPA